MPPTVDLHPVTVNRADTRLIPDRQAGDTRWAHSWREEEIHSWTQRRRTMRKIRNGALALALVGSLVACSDDQAATDPVANEDQQTTSETPTPDCPAVALHYEDLAPGCWAIQIRGLEGSPLAELDVPAGFSGNGAWVWRNADKEDNWGAITLLPVGDVYPDPCTRSGNPPKVGPSVEDFARALAAQKVTTTTTPVPVSLDGHDGVYLEQSTPAGFDLGRCRDGDLSSWEAIGEPAGGPDPGSVSRYWVLDVDGQRVVLVVNTNTSATDETVDLLTGIAEAATFDEG
jgi:hypothetical protein